MSPLERFERIADRLLGEPGVEERTGFGSSPGLRVDGSIFAMLVDDRLVVKLAATRCRDLVRHSVCDYYDRGQGRPLKQWVTARPDASWSELAGEALEFVRGSERAAGRAAGATRGR